MNGVLENALADATYRPYCLGCMTMERMAIVDWMYWRCAECGAEHDERAPADAATMTETPRCNASTTITAKFPGLQDYKISTEPPCTMDSDCECSCCKKVFAAQRGSTR